MDYKAWHCVHETPAQKMFCPEEGCSKRLGCARDRGWKLGEPTPRAYQGYRDPPPILSATPEKEGE